ncbi:MAG: polyprenyl synthetase family protein, partial [Deltaproteobacteria bacterium]|nr:polyprenyl synthetase family protein [Deltaproteobacteria bacterium]
KTRQKAEEAVQKALAALDGFDNRAAMLMDLARYILSRKR